MDILKALENVDLNDEQIAALDKFFEEFKTKITNDIAKKYEEGVDTEKYILREQAEQAFAMFEADCERAFDLFEDDAEQAFAMFEEDAEKAFELGVDDVQKTYTENMAMALQEVYDEVSERVKKDFLESKEYKTIQKLKDLIIPLLEETDNDLVAKIKSLSEETEKKDEEIQKLAKANAITTLLKDIPEEYVATVEEFISAGKTEDEVIERFNTIVEMLETKLSVSKKQEEEKRFARKQKTEEPTKPVTEETKKEEVKPTTEEVVEDKKSEDGKPVFRSILEEVETREAKITPLNDRESAIIDKIFAN